MVCVAEFLDSRAGKEEAQGVVERKHWVRPVGRDGIERFIMAGEVGPLPIEPYCGGGQGGPGQVCPYPDDAVSPGPGELEEEAYYERLILKRVELIEQYLIGGRVVREIKKDLGRKN